MAEIISRLFSSASNAAAAVKDVQEYRFAENEVFTIDPASGVTLEDLAAQIVQAGVSKTNAAIYAEKVHNGSTLVVVHAPFGSAKKATVLLDRHQPIPAPIATAPLAPPIRYDRAAPLSSLFQWPTILSNPAPFSSFWNLQILSHFSLSKRWGRPELSNDPAPLSTWLKIRTLSGDPAPLSSKMNVPTLRPYVSGRNNLMDDPAPLSRLLGWATLSRPYRSR